MASVSFLQVDNSGYQASIQNNRIPAAEQQLTIKNIGNVASCDQHSHSLCFGAAKVQGQVT
jgi:hypothetical protein